MAKGLSKEQREKAKQQKLERAEALRKRRLMGVGSRTPANRARRIAKNAKEGMKWATKLKAGKRCVFRGTARRKARDIRFARA